MLSEIIIKKNVGTTSYLELLLVICLFTFFLLAEIMCDNVLLYAMKLRHELNSLPVGFKTGTSSFEQRSTNTSKVT